MLLDEIKIIVKSGGGGSGCESHIRRKDQKMIPNGGDGGDGGDVIVRADYQTGSLVQLKGQRTFEAVRGGHGKGSNMYGETGKNAVIRVPCGTTVYDHTQNLLLRDLAEDGDEVVAVKGGRGGYGNHAGRPARRGEEGKEAELILSLSIVADIFIVGLPNSGKTMLLKTITGAHVEPADYPFSTRTPCLGTYEKIGNKIRMCELPSLYAHSSEGRGLGNAFLKHLKRAKLIFLVIDPVNSFARNLKDSYDILIREIEEFNPDFLKIPRIVVINKMDLKEAKAAVTLKKKPKFRDLTIPVSALKGTGAPKLMSAAKKILKNK